MSASFGKQLTTIQVQKNRIRVFLNQLPIADCVIPSVETATKAVDLSLILGINSGPGGGTAKFRLHNLELRIP